MVEEVTTDLTVSEDSEADAQTLMDGMTGKATTPEETKGKTEESEKTGSEKVETELGDKTKVEEGKETEAPKEDAQLEKVLGQFKTREEAAKAYMHLQGLQQKQTDELGQTRKDRIAYQDLLKRIENDPDGVKRDIDALHKKEVEKESLIDRAIENPKVLDEEIKKQVAEEFDKRDQKALTTTELKKVYKEFDQTATQRENLAEQIELGSFSKDEILHLAVMGHHADEMIRDAKKDARKEDAAALAKKAQAGVETQTGAIASEKEKSDEDILGDAIIGAKR